MVTVIIPAVPGELSAVVEGVMVNRPGTNVHDSQNKSANEQSIPLAGVAVSGVPRDPSHLFTVYPL